MKRSNYLAAAVIFFFCACEKEIGIDYRSVTPLYVVEGRITNETTEVLVTLTRDMEDGGEALPQDQALVSLTTGSGDRYDLPCDSGGFYRATGLRGTAGETYTLTVEADGARFVSRSTMPGPAPIQEPFFQWLKVMGQKFVILTFSFEDLPDQENYYCYRVFRNGENYRWNVLHDRGNDGQTITLDLVCMTEKMASENKEEDWDDILYEGDRIEIELQTIDQRTYDYLFSVGLSSSANTNPIDNFSGGCLGYFAAYSSSRTATVFSYDEILNP
ncbi:MAG: DUF4249 domain-containing protein [Rikenellaceae bacterium]|nr:DUF4249 domain-containing protein [Rikenellaceae bacterium]